MSLFTRASHSQKNRSSCKFLVILHPLGQAHYRCLVQVLFILLKSDIWLITVLLAQVASLFTLFRNLFFATFPFLFPFLAFLCFRFVFAIRACNCTNIFNLAVTHFKFRKFQTCQLSILATFKFGNLNYQNYHRNSSYTLYI